MSIDLKALFWELYKCPVEVDVENILKKYNIIGSSKNWRPYGGNENNYGVVENQQASPIPALVEKLTNGIDAILEKRCLEENIDPKCDKAPRSVEDGIKTFFPKHENWDLSSKRHKQAEMLQILADGPRGETSLVIYDPRSFPDRPRTADKVPNIYRYPHEHSPQNLPERHRSLYLSLICS